MSKLRLWARDNKNPWLETRFVDTAAAIAHIPLNSEDPWPRDVPIRISLERPPYDCFPCGPLEICSPRLQAALADEPVEFLPVELSGHPVGGYAALHVMAHAPVLDRERSSIELRTDDKIMSVRTIVTDESVSPPAGIFHISESYSGLIFFTVDLAERLEGFTGLRTTLPTARRW